MPEKDDQEKAALLADALLGGVGTGQREYRPEKQDVFVADVEAAVDRFDFQAKLCLREEIEFPCLADGDEAPVPLDWLGLVPPLLPFRRLRDYPLPFFFEELFFREAVRPPFKLVPPAEAIRLLRIGLLNFLVARFGARQSSIATSPGIWFRVITNTHGLRVHYTPAYFINWSNVFGSPTSPVDGWIQPGRYKFGAMGTNFPFRYDPANFNIPPQKSAQLMSI